MTDHLIGNTVLQLRWSVPPDRVPAWEDWYNQEHLGDVVRLPRVLNGRRFIRELVSFSSNTDFNFLTLYELADESALGSPEYAVLSADPSPWTLRVALGPDGPHNIPRSVAERERRTGVLPSGARAAARDDGSRP